MDENLEIMASSQHSSYPFIQTCDDNGALSIPMENNAEPMPHTETGKDNLLNQIESKLTTIVTTEATRTDLHKDAVIDRLPPVDILIFGRAGVGKSCLLKAITNDPDIVTSAQLDHVTQSLQSVTKKIGKLTFRFWDTKGIDQWSTSDDVMNLLTEMEAKKIKPLFVIYCASGSGRVNSGIVKLILNELRGNRTPVAYVITNLYNHSNEQRQGQFQGGLDIMREIYLIEPTQKNKYYYEFDVLTNDDKEIVRDGKGILIGVNSEPYINDLTNTNIPQLNIFELMSFVAINLNDDDFARFVALTLQNRGFWAQCWDGIATQLYRCRDKLSEYGIQLRDFIRTRFKSTTVQ